MSLYYREISMSDPIAAPAPEPEDDLLSQVPVVPETAIGDAPVEENDQTEKDL